MTTQPVVLVDTCWHPVDESLPEAGEEDVYLVSTEGGPALAYFDFEQVWREATTEAPVEETHGKVGFWTRPPASPRTEPRSLPAARRRFEMAIHGGKEPERTGP